MASPRRQLLCSLQPWLLLLTGIFVVLTLAGQTQTAQQTLPTSGQDAQMIDRTWQRASSKYDSERNTILSEVRRAANEGPYRADWQSLQKYEVPDWYKDAKFGIFIHWGVYSVPAFGSEWYPRNMYRQDSDEYKHHLSTYGLPGQFGYKDFIPNFRAEHFAPAACAHLFKEAGARSTLFRSSSITTASPCTIAAFLTGRPRKWVRGGMCTES